MLDPAVAEALFRGCGCRAALKAALLVLSWVTVLPAPVIGRALKNDAYRAILENSLVTRRARHCFVRRRGRLIKRVIYCDRSCKPPKGVFRH